MNRFYYFFTIFFIYATSIYAQKNIKQEYSHNHYGIAEGMPSEIVTCVFQDSKGFIWFGTDYGLTCFDGQKFTPYLTEKSLPINKIEENSQGDILIYGYYFIYTLNRKTNLLHKTFSDDNLNYCVQESPGLPTGYSLYSKRDSGKKAIFKTVNNKLVEFFSHPLLDKLDYGQGVSINENEKLIYIPSENNLYILDYNGNIIRKNPNINIRRFIKKENQIFGISYQSVWQINAKSVKKYYDFNKPLLSIKNQDAVFYAVFDKNENLIICSSDGVHIYKDNTFETIISDIIIPTMLMIDREDNLWFTSRQGVYNFFNLNTIIYKLKSDQVDMFESVVPVKNDEIYTTTAMGKIYHYKNNIFSPLFFPMPSTNTSVEFSYRSIKYNDDYYFTTYNDILRYHKGQFTWLNIPPEKYHVCSCILKDSCLAIGGWEKIMILNKEGKKIDEIFHANIAQNTIYSFIDDEKGNIWIGGHKGICCVDRKTKKMLHSFFADQYMNGESVVKDHSGRIWFACENHIYYVDKDSLFLFMEFPETIFINLCYTRDNLLIASHIKGMYLIDVKTKKTVIYDNTNGFSCGEPIWNTMQEDFEGNVWVSTYSSSLVKFNPVKIFEKQKKYQFYLTAKQYSQDNIHWKDIQDKSKLSHKDNSIKFSFIGLCFSDPENIYYRYRLIGYQTDWSEPTKERTALFQNLPYGNYILEVGICDNSDTLENTILKYSFTIYPAFWQNTWFILTVFFFIIAIPVLITFLAVRKRHKKTIEDLIMKKKLNELTINNIRLKAIPHFNANVLTVIEYYIINKSKEEAIAALNTYSQFTYQTLLEVGKPARSLYDELLYVKMYLDLEKMRFVDKFNYEINIDSEVDQAVKLPNMILHTWVENAIKHGLSGKINGGLIIISAKLYNNQYVIVSVEDNGVGRKVTAQNTNIRSSKQGLSILYHQVEIYNHFNTNKITLLAEDLQENEVGLKTRYSIIMPYNFKYNFE